MLHIYAPSHTHINTRWSLAASQRLGGPVKSAIQPCGPKQSVRQGDHFGQRLRQKAQRGVPLITWLDSAQRRVPNVQVTVVPSSRRFCGATSRTRCWTSWSFVAADLLTDRSIEACILLVSAAMPGTTSLFLGIPCAHPHPASSRPRRRARHAEALSGEGQRATANYISQGASPDPRCASAKSAGMVARASQRVRLVEEVRPTFNPLPSPESC